MTLARTFILLSLLLAPAAKASQAPDLPFSPPPVANNASDKSNDALLSTARGLATLDYLTIPVPGYQAIDLLSVHYLHQLYPWLYLGLGFDAPLVKGNYGGFMVLDTTLHAQKKVYGNFFVDAGLSFGGGGGGSSKQQSKELSGYGGYRKEYAGLGYDFGGFLAGVNLAHVRFTHSLIDHSQLNFYIQKPLSFPLGRYADAGKSARSDPDFSENILGIELNNLFQIDPRGSNKETINAVALQYSHFLDKTQYIFVDADVGYSGLGLYNQALLGVGGRLSMSPKWNLYGQIGVGSGGWAPDVIDTGTGLLIYPKVSAEYRLSKNIGLALSGGYLFAPKGSSKNATLGLGLNYHLSSGGKDDSGVAWDGGRTLRGFSVHLFQQTLRDVDYGGKKDHNVDMFSAQIDSDLNANWYIPVQVSIAYSDAAGYPGYGELFAGIGRNHLFPLTKNLNSYAQLTIGTNTRLLLRPALGLSYTLNDKLALYGQIAQTMSLDTYSNGKRYSDNSLGIGLSYRFSVLD